MAFVGARMATTLFALELGASEFTVGLLMALFALLPMLLSVASGRLIDRAGPGRPVAAAMALLALAAALPFLVPRLGVLYFSSTALGVAFLFIHIGMNSVLGAYGKPEGRAMNFAWLAIGFSISGSLGPLITGLAIDLLGHARAFALLAAFPVLALAMQALRRRPLPRPERAPRDAGADTADLLRIPALRGVLLVSGFLAMGWDLYAFLLPLYGARLGLAAAAIGGIMSVFAVATFAVRLVMPVLIRRCAPWPLIAGALALSGVAYLAFPFVGSVPLLMALSFVLGIGLGSAQPVLMALLYDASPLGRQGEAVGVRTLVLNASHTAIPLVSGALAAALSIGAAFWILAACLLAGAWMARQRVK